MNIAKFSVARPVAVTMRIAALVLLGWICLMRLPIDLLPKIDIPTISVNVSWPNTSPEEMETQIARPLEQAVGSVKGLYLVSSNSSLGNASVRIQFNYGVNLDQAFLDVQQTVQRAQGRFPSDPNISFPSIFKFDPSSLPILSYGVTGGKDMIKLRDRMVNEISPIIEASGGIGAVNVSGGYVRSVQVNVDPEKLRAYGIGIATISKRLQQENLSLPAGFAREGNTEYGIRSVGYFKSIDELRKAPLGVYNGDLVTLGEVADVTDATQDIRYYVRLNGEDALNVSVTKQSDANTVEVANGVKARVADIQKRYPDLKFKLVYDQSSFIEHSIDDLKQTAVIGGALAILIILFFLRNLRSTFVVALSIPISIIWTFSLLYFCWFTLNTISFTGLALASGLIVDDAIVVLENVYRHIQKDKKRAADAAVSGTQEIISAVLASTFTVMIVFLPLLMLQGRTGQTFIQFALVVVFSLGISLLDATTVVPMLCSRMIKEQEVIEEEHPELREKPAGPLTRLFDKFGVFFHGLDASYRNGLTWALKHRLFVVGGALTAVAAAVALWPFVGREQIPQTDSGNIQVNARMPIGTALEKTNLAVRQIEAGLAADPDVESFITGAGANVGLRGAGQSSPNNGGATVRLKQNRKSSTDAIAKRLTALFKQIPGARISVTPFDLVANILGGGNAGMSVDVYGNDITQLTTTAHTVSEALGGQDGRSGIQGLEGVDLAVQDSNPELQWNVDRDKAQSMGISFSDIATTLSTATSGQLSSYYQENGFQYPIYVQVPMDKRLSIEQLEKLPVAGTESRPSPVLLGQVATSKIGAGPAQINRQNRQRVINVGGRIANRPENEVQADVIAAMNKIQMPEGSYWTLGVQQQQAAKEFSGLGVSVFLAIALIYMLLATQFESFVLPLIVLTSVPLCAIGLVLALFLTNRSFGLTAFIGLLMLIGIVVKNGILLVDYTNQLRARGYARDEAILMASPARLRPILMTSIAAMLGMLPLALGIGQGSEMYVPLATAVIGGLLTSTILTLFIVPTVYTLFDDLIRRFRKDERDLSQPTLIEPTVASVGGSGIE